MAVRAHSTRGLASSVALLSGASLIEICDAAVNPGVCPVRHYTSEECTWIRFVSCTDDSDCAKNEKCCSNGCGLQCMAPATVKPGVCPSGNIDPAVCRRTRFRWMCDNDSDCAKNEKCCHNGCVLQCMAPVTVKPGVCPIRRYTAEECTWIRFVSCTDDSDCANNWKCCSNGCGLQCMAPATVKPGVCPRKRYTPKECDMIRYVMAPTTCVDDSDCVKNEKCCSDGCIRQCMAPLKVPFLDARMVSALPERNDAQPPEARQ
ncbi:WAP four-disulfide core domain protein 3-like [Pseudorasbora parva]|uniref:WAP four-disulfide core domain protein 3-like n=1 Tax=Pseudorasbora parva TaxID=51549 RepID=UPI00351E708D